MTTRVPSQDVLPTHKRQVTPPGSRSPKVPTLPEGPQAVRATRRTEVEGRKEGARPIRAVATGHAAPNPGEHTPPSHPPPCDQRWTPDPGTTKLNDC